MLGHLRKKIIAVFFCSMAKASSDGGLLVLVVEKVHLMVVVGFAATLLLRELSNSVVRRFVTMAPQLKKPSH